MNKDLAASVRARLLNVAKAQSADFNQVLVRFALERILYRLSQSAHADQFLLQGALLFTLWYDMPHRRRATPICLASGPATLSRSPRHFVTSPASRLRTVSSSIRLQLVWKRSARMLDTLAPES